MKIRLTYEYTIPKEQDDWSTALIAMHAAHKLERILGDSSHPLEVFSKVERTHGIWTTDVTKEVQGG